MQMGFKSRNSSTRVCAPSLCWTDNQFMDMFWGHEVSWYGPPAFHVYSIQHTFIECLICATHFGTWGVYTTVNKPSKDSAIWHLLPGGIHVSDSLALPIQCGKSSREEASRSHPTHLRAPEETSGIKWSLCHDSWALGDGCLRRERKEERRQCDYNPGKSMMGERTKRVLNCEEECGQKRGREVIWGAKL